MSSAPKPAPWPPDPSDELLAPSPGDNYVSEFLSEKSPEFEAVRQAAASARTESATPPLALPPVSTPTTGRIATARLAPWPWLVAYAAVAAVVVTIVWLFGGTLPSYTGSSPASTEGTATIVSRPEGAEVFIGGEPRGVTPLRVSLPVGTYELELRNGGAVRTLTLQVESGTAVREVIDLAPTAVAGRLEVTSDVPGARVTVGGIDRGVTPLVLSDIPPGTHQVAISRAGTTVNRSVTVEAGATATVVASVIPSGVTGGWLTFDTPLDMQVIENGQILGTTGADRLMVPAGRRELELVADPFGFRTTTSVVVGVGRTVAIPVSVPDGRLSINAVPWAEVWLNGQPLGSTPLANLTVPIGDHTVVLRHPEFGERRQEVRVTANTPARIGLDLTR